MPLQSYETKALNDADASSQAFSRKAWERTKNQQLHPINTNNITHKKYTPYILYNIKTNKLPPLLPILRDGLAHTNPITNSL